MVSGVETSLIIRANSIVSGAGLFPQSDEDNPQNTIDSTAVPTARGLTDASVLTPFGRDGENGSNAEERFVASGLNGLLAPFGIAAVQEENESARQGSIAIEGASDAAADPGGASQQAASSSGSANSSEGEGPDGLTEEEQEVVEELKQRDAEVRRHEQAHKAVGGQYAGAISYTYQSGPDGRRYAVGGEVPIETSPVAGDPEATIRKLEQVRRAALAPAEPSSADQAVAAQASQGIQQARAELAQQSAEELQALTEGGQESETESGENAQGTSPSAADGADDAASGFVQAQGPQSSVSPSGAQDEGVDLNRLSPFSLAGVNGSDSVTGEGTDGQPADRVTVERAGQSPFDIAPRNSVQTLDISI